jgi:protein required for attachment to host cells
MNTGNLWILVMNSTRARILRGVPSRAPARAELVLRSNQRRLREVISDTLVTRPMSQFNGPLSEAGWRRPLDEDEVVFSRQVAALLEAHRLAGDFGRLAVFAAPEMLEILHQAMPPALRDRIVAEVDENLIALSEAELPKRVAADLGRL